MISYKPFFETLKRLGISQYSIENDYGLSRGTLSSLRANRNMNLKSIEKLCKLLDCDMSNIVEFIDENQEN